VINILIDVERELMIFTFFKTKKKKTFLDN